jgi:hypothetical protein
MEGIALLGLIAAAAILLFGVVLIVVVAHVKHKANMRLNDYLQRFDRGPTHGQVNRWTPTIRRDDDII